MARRDRRRAEATRWEEDNRLATNPWAFVAVAALFGAPAALFLLLWLL